MGKIYTCILLLFALSVQAGTIAGIDTRVESVCAIDPTVKVSFYPNPCTKILNVDVLFEKNINQVEIHLRNIIGKDVIEYLTDEKTQISNHYEIDLSDVPAGVYLLEIITTVNGSTSKVIKRVTKM